ncbi:hypothetical protein V8F20_006212 [Naviculisporaceae sp. PSN 640]
MASILPLDPSCLKDFNATYGGIFERTFCYNNIVEFLNSSNVTSSPACMRALFIDGASTNLNNPLLTLQGCKAFCGADWGPYPDSASRVFDWVVPIMVLVSNIDLSPVERRVMMGIIHALGDPIDITWSILDKLYALQICHQTAKKAVETTRLSGGPRIHNNEGDSFDTTSVAPIQPKKAFQTDDRSVQVQITAIDTNTPEPPDSPPSPATIPGTNPKDRIRIIATVLGGFEELAGHLMTCPREFYSKAISMLGNPAAEYIQSSSYSPLRSQSQSISNISLIPNPSISQWLSTAIVLVDDRTNQFLRTGMAVLLYFFQVTSEFVDQISQNSENTPGGRIGAAMMLSWLIPVALLSNLLGGFPSRRSNLRPLLDLLNETLPARYRPGQDQNGALPDHSQWSLLHATQEQTPHAEDDDMRNWDDYLAFQRQTGAIYGFRPHKTHLIAHGTGRDKIIRLLLPVISTLPVIASFLASFILHWEAVPAGFSCRHVWIITVFCLWLISPILTYLFYFIIGFGTIAMIIASVIGLFNSCFCWSLAMWLGEANAVMAVNTRATYLQYKKGLYPGLVGAFIFVEVAFVAVVAGLLCRGLGVMRWGEKNKRTGWDLLRGKDLKVLRSFLDAVRT